MHVLITRPERDCAELRSRLQAFGCTVSVSPLLTIELLEIPVAALLGASALIATSRNGLRALAQSPALDQARAIPLFAVGPATAALARELGFHSIYEGAGTAAELVPMIADAPAEVRRQPVHLAGDHLAFNLGAALAEAGIPLTAIPAYHSVAAKTLTEPVQHLLATCALDAVVLMSPRSARVWGQLLSTLPVKVDLTNLVHVCLSPNVAQALKEVLKPLETLGAVRTETAVRPVTEEIVALVYRLAGQPKTG